MIRKPKDALTLQVVIGSCLALAMLVILAIVGFDTKKVADNVLETKSIISTREAQTKEITRLKEEAAIAADKKTIIESILPKKDDLFSFPGRITSIGSAQNVRASFSFGREEEKHIGYGIVAQGDYLDIVNFVRVLEEDIQFMSLSSFDITSGDGGYTINLGGNLFFNGEEG